MADMEFEKPVDTIASLIRGTDPKVVKVRADWVGDDLDLNPDERCKAITRDGGKTWDVENRDGRLIYSGDEQDTAARFKPVVRLG